MGSLKIRDWLVYALLPADNIDPPLYNISRESSSSINLINQPLPTIESE
jgi:hypothetical protein